MTDKVRKSIVSEYLHKLIQVRASFISLPRKQSYFFQGGVGKEISEYKNLFSDLASKVEKFKHNIKAKNYDSSEN